MNSRRCHRAPTPTAPNVWCNVDIACYFPSIKKRAILGEPLRRYVSGPALLGVLERILSASPSDTGVGIPKGPVNFGYHDHVFSFLSGVIFSPVGSSALAAVRAAGQASVEALEGARMTVPEARSVSKS